MAYFASVNGLFAIEFQALKRCGCKLFAGRERRITIDSILNFARLDL